MTSYFHTNCGVSLPQQQRYCSILHIIIIIIIILHRLSGNWLCPVVNDSESQDYHQYSCYI